MEKCVNVINFKKTFAGDRLTPSFFAGKSIRGWMLKKKEFLKLLWCLRHGSSSLL